MRVWHRWVCTEATPVDRMISSWTNDMPHEIEEKDNSGDNSEDSKHPGDNFRDNSGDNLEVARRSRKECDRAWPKLSLLVQKYVLSEKKLCIFHKMLSYPTIATGTISRLFKIRSIWPGWWTQTKQKLSLLVTNYVFPRKLCIFHKMLSGQR